MSRFQAGALVVYGNLGVHEVEGVGLRRFCDEPAREYYTLRPYFSDSHDRSYIPTAKEDALRPVVKAAGQFSSPFFRSHPYWVVANKSHLPHLLCRTSSEKEEL